MSLALVLSRTMRDRQSGLVILLLCGFILTDLPLLEAAEEGDSCTVKANLPGVCKASSKCEPLLEKYIKTGTLTGNEVPSCGLGTHEEIVCCPIAECCPEDTRPRQFAGTTTTTTTTRPTTTTTTRRTTTTTTATKLDNQSSFIDLQQLLSERTTTKRPSQGQVAINGNGVNENPDPSLIDEPVDAVWRSFNGFQDVGPLGPAPTTAREPKIINRPQSMRLQHSPVGGEGCEFTVCPAEEEEQRPGQRQGQRPGETPAQWTDNWSVWPGQGQAGRPVQSQGPWADQGPRQRPGQRVQEWPGQGQGQRPEVAWEEWSGQRTEQGQRPGVGWEDWSGQRPEQGQRPGVGWEDWSGQRPGQEIGQRPGQDPGQWPGEWSIQRPGQRQGQRPGQRPGRRQGQRPGQRPEQRAKPGQEPTSLIQLVNDRLRQQGMNVQPANEVTTFATTSTTRPTPTHPTPATLPILPTVAPATATTTQATIHNIDLDPWAPFRFRPSPGDELDTNELGQGEEQGRGVAEAFGPETTTTRTIQVTPTTRVDISPTKERPAVRACRQIEERQNVNSLSPHILDGVPVQDGIYPHMAAIAFSNFGSFSYRCGGSLISPRHVLTAAHCVNSIDDTPVHVRLGTVNIQDVNEHYQDIAILGNVTIHPDYVSNAKYNDIAILELAEEAKLSYYIYPACLETNIADPPANSKLFVAGWGTMNQTTRRTSKILLRAPLSIVPLDQCASSFAELPSSQRFLSEGVIKTLLCAADSQQQKDACQGDSGGPLVIEQDIVNNKYSILGIISSGFGCATKTPGLYTRVASYLDFIESVVWPNNEV